MRSRISSWQLTSGVVLVALSMTTGCKTGGWSGSSWAWNPMKMWRGDAPAASSLASTKPSTQIPTPNPTSSVATRSSAPTAPTITTPGYGGSTAPGSSVAGYPTNGYPATANATGYPTQPATGYGTPGQPGQVAPATGYATGPYGMTATPAGGASAQQGPWSNYTATAQSTAAPTNNYQTQPYQTQPYQSQPYQAQPYQAQPAAPSYGTPTYNQPADSTGGYNNSYNTPPASAYPPSSTPPAAQPNTYNQGGYNTGGYMQGGFNSSSTGGPAAPWQTQEAGGTPAANGYAAAPATAPQYDASTAGSTVAPATSGDYATAYNTPAPEGARPGNVDVSGVTTGVPASNLPASLAAQGGYRPGSTGRDPGVQNAGYQQPNGYGSGGTIYR